MSSSFSSRPGGTGVLQGDAMLTFVMARRGKNNGASGFGPRLRQLREERALSQSDLARLAGLTTTDVSRYERSEVVPSIDNFAHLVQALEVPADLLLLGKLPSGTARPEPHNLRLWKRLLALEQMNDKDQQVALHLLDSLIIKNRIEGALEPSR